MLRLLPEIVEDVDKGAGASLVAEVVVDEDLGLTIDLLDGGGRGLSERDW